MIGIGTDEVSTSNGTMTTHMKTETTATNIIEEMNAITGTCPMVPQILTTAATGGAITVTWAAQAITTAVTDTTVTSTGTVTGTAAALQTTAMVQKALTTAMDEATIGEAITATGGIRQKMRCHPGLATMMRNGAGAWMKDAETTGAKDRKAIHVQTKE